MWRKRCHCTVQPNSNSSKKYEMWTISIYCSIWIPSLTFYFIWFFYNFFYLALQSKNKTKQTNLVVQVLSIFQLRKGNHSITDLGLVVPNYTNNFKRNYLLVKLYIDSQCWVHGTIVVPPTFYRTPHQMRLLNKPQKSSCFFFGRWLGRVLHTLGKKEKLKQNREIFGLSEMTQLFMVVIIGILYRIVESRWNRKS